MLEDLMGALDLVFVWENFFWAFIGVLCGAVMGAIPGLTDTMAIVLLLPFTYYLGPIPGIAMLMGLSKGGNFGGSPACHSVQYSRHAAGHVHRL